ncbi:MAG TPA: HAMP domain-containing protein [Afifellaceae bacterium]|nr:HAMP domain-containing protein [Afifellaceae bacterium]
MRILGSSFGGKLTLAVLLAATAAITIFVATAFLRLEQGMLRQSDQLSMLAEATIAERLDGKARLASGQLDLLQTRVARLLSLIALRADVANAILSRNVVAIQQILAGSLRDSQIDQVLVADHRMHIIGSSSDETDLIAVNRALAVTPLVSPLRRILAANDRSSPFSYRDVLELDQVLAAVFDRLPEGGLAFIGISPVFDDFGDPVAALVAVRTLRTVEPELAQFAETRGEGVAVLSETGTISAAGLDNTALPLQPLANLPFLATPDHSLLARCSGFREKWRVCALVPFSTLDAFRARLVAIAEAEAQSIALWLLAMATLALLVCGAGTFTAARRLTAPLVRITEALRSTAVGDWRAPVEGDKRTDEIGEIARAVLILQRSVRERQQLASEAASSRVVHAEKTRLEALTAEMEASTRALLIDLTDNMERMDETAHALSRTSGIAEGEADEASFVLDGIASRLASSQSPPEPQSWQTGGCIGKPSDLTAGPAAGIALSVQQICHLSGLAGSLLEAAGSVAERDLCQAAELDGPREALRQRIDLASRTATAVRQICSQMEDQADHLKGLGDHLKGLGGRAATISLVEGSRPEKVRCDADNYDLAGTPPFDPVREGLQNLRVSLDNLRSSARVSRLSSGEMIERALSMADEARSLNRIAKNFLSEIRGAEAAPGDLGDGLSSPPCHGEQEQPALVPSCRSQCATAAAAGRPGLVSVPPA